MAVGELRSAGFADLDPTTLYALLRLRCDVFVVEQACAYRELDGRDLEPRDPPPVDRRRRPVVAYLRVLDDGDVRRIGRVVTAATHRAPGPGRRAGGRRRWRRPTGPVVLDAQAYLSAWYEAFGFRVERTRVPRRRHPARPDAPGPLSPLHAA